MLWTRSIPLSADMAVADVITADKITTAAINRPLPHFRCVFISFVIFITFFPFVA
jgi:hypothetical protein